MSGDLDLEQRYRRVLRLLPGYYRDKWEEDMVAAFLDSWMTGDPDEDSVTMEYDRPTRQEIASVIALAARLYLGGTATPRRYYAWGQALRLAAIPKPAAFHRSAQQESGSPASPPAGLVRLTGGAELAGQATGSVFLVPGAAVTALAWLRSARKRCWAPCLVSP
jgi:hypothetical protein